TQMTNSFLPSTVAVVIQICFPQMTGEDQPLSWMATFHLMFSVSLQRIGKPTASARPSPDGPRNSGQLSPPLAAEPKTAAMKKQTIPIIRKMSGFQESDWESRCEICLLISVCPSRGTSRTLTGGNRGNRD